MKPLGLPGGSVRSILALGALASAGYLWVTGQPVTPEHLSIVAGTLAYYFSGRSKDEPAPPTVDLEALDLLKQARDRDR